MCVIVCLFIAMSAVHDENHYCSVDSFCETYEVSFRLEVWNINNNNNKDNVAGNNYMAPIKRSFITIVFHFLFSTPPIQVMFIK